MKNLYGNGTWDIVTRKGSQYHRLRKIYSGILRKEFTGKTKAEVKRKQAACEKTLESDRSHVEKNSFDRRQHSCKSNANRISNSTR